MKRKLRRGNLADAVAPNVDVIKTLEAEALKVDASERCKNLATDGCCSEGGNEGVNGTNTRRDEHETRRNIIWTHQIFV